MLLIKWDWFEQCKIWLILQGFLTGITLLALSLLFFKVIESSLFFWFLIILNESTTFVLALLVNKIRDENQ